MMFYTQWNQIMLSSLSIWIWLPTAVLGFNVDTNNTNVIKGPPGTLFGYSASFLPRNKNDSALAMFVGAPSADTNDTLGGPGSGVIHLCTNVLDPREDCVTKQRYGSGMNMVNGSYNERFGSTITMTDSGKYMVCSPDWKDTSSLSFHFSPGRCSYIDPTSSLSDEYRPFYQASRTAKEKYYIIQIDTKSEYYEGLATLGVSADSNRASIFVLGAPGVFLSEGTVVIVDMDSQKSSRINIELKNNLNTKAYGYLGYSVKIGRFCDGSDICFAAGAPNQNRVGMAYIYRWKDKQNVIAVSYLTGKQAWSSFGHSLCAVDANSDGYDELLVGAPYYTITDDKLEGYDQGRVYVYARSDTNEKYEQQQIILEGTKQKFARFGSAIQNIGDVNLDNYNDVVVGAPGEDEGAGCIYIYLGGQKGLSSHSQRITAKQASNGLTEPIRGFGFAFSEHATTAKNNYPIFVATSVVSNAIVVFKIRPIVDVVATMTADPNPVDMEKPCTETGTSGACFKIEFCMKFQLRGGGSSNLNFQVGLDMDVQVRSNLKRALIKLSNGSLVESTPELQKNLAANANDDCIVFLAVLQDDQVNQERFKPIEIIGKYMLVEDSTSSLNPMLDVMKPSNVMIAVTILNKCGDDNICAVDLSVTGNLMYDHTSSWNSIVINATRRLQVNVAVHNSKETSFWTVIRIEIDSALTYSRSISDVPVTCQHEQPLLDAANTVANAAPTRLDKTMVVCNFYKPLYQNRSMSLNVVFETDQMGLSKKTLTITAKAMPKNNNYNPETSELDNTITLKTDVEIISDLSIHGTSSPSEDAVFDVKKISITDTSGHYRKTGNEIKPFNVTHKILIRNDGPSFLPQTTVSVHVPIFLLDRTELISEASVKIATADGSEANCYGTRTWDYLERTTTTTTQTVTTNMYATSESEVTHATETTPGTTAETDFDNININRRRKRATDDKVDQSTVYTLDCKHPDICQVFVCDVGTIIPSGSHAEINVSLVIDKANIPMPENYNAFYYTVEAFVNEPTHPLFKDWVQKPAVKTVTMFHVVQSGGKVNIWIIIGCVIAGLVLITIIVLVFWKLGFFKRDKHKQVENWRRQSQRQSRKGYSKAPAEDVNMDEVPPAD